MERTFAEMAALLRIGAEGYLPDEAAIDLLIGHGTWLYRSDFVSTCVMVETDPDLVGDGAAAYIHWPAAVRALDAGDLPCSTSEASVLRIAAGIGGIPVDLRAMLSGLDARNIVLVAKAVMHANGTPVTALAQPSPHEFGVQPPSTTPGRSPQPTTQPKEDRRHG